MALGGNCIVHIKRSTPEAIMQFIEASETKRNGGPNGWDVIARDSEADRDTSPSGDLQIDPDEEI